jgi:hypothetical protein
MPAVEIQGECEIYNIDDAFTCDSKTVKYEVKIKDEFETDLIKVCANCVHLAEQMGWISSFIEWRDS